MAFDCKRIAKIYFTFYLFLGSFAMTTMYSQNFSSFSFGGPGIETIKTIIPDEDTLIISGTFTQSFQWEEFTLTSEGARDFYIAKTDLYGRPYSIYSDGSGRDDEIANLIKHTDGNLIIGGTSWGASKYGFLSTIGGSGTSIWKKYIRSTGGLELISLATINQQLFAAGTYQNTMEIGDTTIQSEFPNNIWVAEFDVFGNFKKVNQFNASNNVEVVKMIALQDGSLILSGQYDDSLVTYIDTLIANTFDDDLFLMSLDTNLNINWLIKGGGVHRDAVIDLVSNDFNQIFVAGDFVGRLIFSEEEELNSTDGIGDAFLVSFDKNGQLLWKKTLGGLNFQGIHALHNFNQTIIVCGSLETQITNESELLVSFEELKNRVFLAHFNTAGDFLSIETFNNSSQFFPTNIFGDSTTIGLTGSYSNLLTIGNQEFESPFNYQAIVANTNQATTQINNSIKSPPSVTLYPNPTSGNLYYQSNQSFSKIFLYHSSGIKIKQLHPNHNVIDLPILPSGIYHLLFFDKLGNAYLSSFYRK